MSFKKMMEPYKAGFIHGVRTCINDRADMVSMVLIYTMLLFVFSTIFKIMPVDELGRSDITGRNLFWYFVVTEIVLVSVQGNERELGRLIAEGQLTNLIQRPCSMLGLWLSRIYGTVITNVIVLSMLACILVPIVFDMPTPLDVSMFPLLVLSVMMATVIFLLIGYCVSMIEIFGAYSRSFNLILNKMIFTFGGLFFPVIFFPEILQKIVHLTPGPSILFIPGSFMLNPDKSDIVLRLGEQLLWLLITVSMVVIFQKKMVAYILERGD